MIWFVWVASANDYPPLPIGRPPCEGLGSAYLCLAIELLHV